MKEVRAANVDPFSIVSHTTRVGTSGGRRGYLVLGRFINEESFFPLDREEVMIQTCSN